MGEFGGSSSRVESNEVDDPYQTESSSGTRIQTEDTFIIVLSHRFPALGIGQRGKLGILQPECHVTLDGVAPVAGNGGEQVFTERFLSELYRPGGGREIKLALYLHHGQIVLGAVIVLLVEVYRFDAIVPTVGEELFRAVEHVQLLQWESDLYDKEGENQ